MPTHIGPYQLSSPVILAPMAGVTDQPFRTLCKRLGAGMVVAEMLTSDSRLWQSRKSQLRLIHHDEPEPRSVQIAGAEPEMMAEAARLCVEQGAQIVDINMGCPAKKVLRKEAGSALLKNPALVERILRAVVAAVDVPVTLKIRTGWCPESRNGVEIARLAEQTGIQMLTVHGRTRACRFKGEAEYDTIAAIKQAVNIPVIANGDITSPEKARLVLARTGADGLMIGRGAQGRPWIFRAISHYLSSGMAVSPPAPEIVGKTIASHLRKIYALYGDHKGVLFARKHLSWYTAELARHQNPDSPCARQFWQRFSQQTTPAGQLAELHGFFGSLTDSTVTNGVMNKKENREIAA